MGDEAAGLHRENEAGRSQGFPVGKSLLLRKPIEAIVDLDRLELAGYQENILSLGKRAG